MNSRPVVLSGAQPSGSLTLGNYLGALKQWVNLQQTSDAIFCIVDLHALTGRLSPELLRQYVFDLTALYLAVGLDPSQCTLFLQSQVPQHTALMWSLMSFAPYGDLTRMTQFKDKSLKAQEVHAGLFTYPSLMVADILLYQTDFVPVGDDQTQHIEFTRSVAERFNFWAKKEIFKIPQRWRADRGSRVMSLTDPKQKMSKSDTHPDGSILLTDDAKSIARKIQGAQTDSERSIRYDLDQKPAISNLLEIFAALKEISIEAAAQQFSDATYVELKQALSQAVIACLTPIQEQYRTLRQDEKQLAELLRHGSLQAQARALPTFEAVQEALGLLTFKS